MATDSERYNAVVAFEVAVRRDERASMPCYRQWVEQDDGAWAAFNCTREENLCPSCAARAERDDMK